MIMLIETSCLRASNNSVMPQSRRVSQEPHTVKMRSSRPIVIVIRALNSNTISSFTFVYTFIACNTTITVRVVFLHDRNDCVLAPTQENQPFTCKLPESIFAVWPLLTLISHTQCDVGKVAVVFFLYFPKADFDALLWWELMGSRCATRIGNSVYCGDRS